MNNGQFEILDIVEHVASGQIAVVTRAMYFPHVREWLYELSTGFNDAKVTGVSGSVLKLHSKNKGASDE